MTTLERRAENVRTLFEIIEYEYTVSYTHLQVNNDIDVKPYSSEHKIYIIDEAEKMNQQAQNALLKTIEEPPAYAIIIDVYKRQHGDRKQHSGDLCGKRWHDFDLCGNGHAVTESVY